MKLKANQSAHAQLVANWIEIQTDLQYLHAAKATIYAYNDGGSCPLKYFELADIASEAILAFSDNFAVQNKNYPISSGKFNGLLVCCMGD